MEPNEVKALLEKYWLAETTVEEEKKLAEYFQGPEPVTDPELEPFRSLFGWIGEESAVTPGPGFESRIMAHISGSAMPAASPLAIAPRNAVSPLRHYNLPLSAAAALVLCVVSLFLVIPKTGEQTSQGSAITTTAIPAPEIGTAMKDTYDDPEKALAAVRRALLVAATRMNQGKHITQNKMSRMNTSLRTVFNN
jgi:hypothetical protein